MFKNQCHAKILNRARIPNMWGHDTLNRMSHRVRPNTVALNTPTWYLLVSVCCQQTHWSQSWCEVLSVITVPDGKFHHGVWKDTKDKWRNRSTFCFIILDDTLQTKVCLNTKIGYCSSLIEISAAKHFWRERSGKRSTVDLHSLREWGLN